MIFFIIKMQFKVLSRIRSLVVVVDNLFVAEGLKG